MVGSGGFIELSTNAGRSWRVISDSSRSVPLGFWAYGNRMFVHSAEFNQAEMWYLDSLNPASVPLPITGEEVDDVRLVSRVGTSATLVVPLGSHEILLCDVLGRCRHIASVDGPGTFTVSLGDTMDPIGFLIVRDASRSVVIPLAGGQ